jgi:NAD(P)-dependent dehydrogenase (short-subunit alcohol dehydrogenase family)
MTSVLVTGTNQGIGFGLVEQLAKRPDVDQVFATVRDPTGDSSTELRNFVSTTPKVHIIKLELNEASATVTSHSTVF